MKDSEAFAIGSIVCFLLAVIFVILTQIQGLLNQLFLFYLWLSGLFGGVAFAWLVAMAVAYGRDKKKIT